jgi:hypothetical protein
MPGVLYPALSKSLVRFQFGHAVVQELGELDQ